MSDLMPLAPAPPGLSSGLVSFEAVASTKPARLMNCIYLQSKPNGYGSVTENNGRFAFVTGSGLLAHQAFRIRLIRPLRAEDIASSGGA